MEAPDSATFDQLHKEHKDADESLYLPYVSETPSPSVERDLSDSFSTSSDVPMREQFTRLDIVPLLSKSDDIKSPLQTIELPLKVHLLSPQILHQEERNDEQIKWVAERINAAASRCQKTDRNNKFLFTSTFNMVRFYTMLLNGDFVHQQGKMIIVTKSAVFATDYVLSSHGESRVMQDIGLIFHEAHPAVVPAQGFWRSSWLTYKKMTTTEYPDTDNTISDVVRNENVGRR